MPYDGDSTARCVQYEQRIGRLMMLHTEQRMFSYLQLLALNRRRGSKELSQDGDSTARYMFTKRKVTHLSTTYAYLLTRSAYCTVSQP